MNNLHDWLLKIKAILEVPLLKAGGTELTPWSILYVVVLVTLLFYISGKLKELLVGRLLARGHLDGGVRQAIGTIVRYLVLALGFVIIMQTAGIDLTALNVLAGAVGIGLGFGLQNIISNFVSGLIILFERPIKVGDLIEVGTVLGTVTAVNARSTTIETNDKVSIIVPNSKFITEHVVNWSYSSPMARFRIPVSVAYGSDAHLVERLLLEAARSIPELLEHPPPDVLFHSFGDNGLDFELRVWSEKLLHRRGILTSRINFAIYESFTAHGIEFPFPQRDLHLKDGIITVKTADKSTDTNPESIGK